MVYGEIHHLRDPTRVLAELDAYECLDDDVPEYQRLLLPVETSPTPVWAYVYVQPAAHLPEIVGGDYRTFFQNKEAHLNFIKQGRNG